MSLTIEEILADSEAGIEEIRAVRHRISAQFDHDPYRLVAFFMQRQRETNGRLVSAPTTNPVTSPGSRWA